MKEENNIKMRILNERIDILEKRIHILEEYSLLAGGKDIDLISFIERLNKRKKDFQYELKLL